MILAEISHWSVVFYLNGDGDGKTLLRQIFEAGKAAKISVGSVGVIEPNGRTTPSDTLVHVDFLHCDRREAQRVLLEANVPLERINFRRVGLRWVKWHHGGKKGPKPLNGDGRPHGF
jgi:hypothetical protein